MHNRSLDSAPLDALALFVLALAILAGGLARLAYTIVFLTDNAPAGGEDRFTASMDIAKIVPWSKF